MVFLSNLPVEDAAGGEVDESLRLPREMFIPFDVQSVQLGRSLFHWDYAQKITRHRTLVDKSAEY